MSKPRRKCAHCGHDRSLHAYSPNDPSKSGPGKCSGKDCKCRCYVQARAFEHVPSGRIHLGGECPRCDAADKVIESLSLDDGRSHSMIKRAKMTKKQFEDLFREDILPGLIARERDGIPDKPGRREAWNNTIDAYIKDRQLPESAGNWSHPRWLESRTGTKKTSRQIDDEIFDALGRGRLW